MDHRRHGLSGTGYAPGRSPAPVLRLGRKGRQLPVRGQSDVASGREMSRSTSRSTCQRSWPDSPDASVGGASPEETKFKQAGRRLTSLSARSKPSWRATSYWLTRGTARWWSSATSRPPSLAARAGVASLQAAPGRARGRLRRGRAEAVVRMHARVAPRRAEIDPREPFAHGDRRREQLRRFIRAPRARTSGPCVSSSDASPMRVHRSAGLLGLPHCARRDARRGRATRAHPRPRGRDARRRRSSRSTRPLEACAHRQMRCRSRWSCGRSPCSGWAVTRRPASSGTGTVGGSLSVKPQPAKPPRPCPRRSGSSSLLG